MLFLQTAVESPFYYFSWVFTVVVSIILHELAHGWAAMWQGDDTPRREGRMTADPLVHMGGYSLIMLFVVGIAWGQMPVNPWRFRSRYGEAFVALAGPAMNLLLAFVALTMQIVLTLIDLLPANDLGRNLFEFLYIFGTANLVLAIFNLIPIPPLDGSKVLANFSTGYRQLLEDPARQGMFTVVFLLTFIFMGPVIFRAAHLASVSYIQWLSMLVS
jgi:Zn-dependent protease